MIVVRRQSESCFKLEDQQKYTTLTTTGCGGGGGCAFICLSPTHLHRCSKRDPSLASLPHFRLDRRFPLQLR